MTEKSLLSMREIARELNLNYRTVIDAKNQFNEFIIAISGKYPRDYKDFFMLIYALRDEGYDTQSIKDLLRGEHEQVPDMDGWVEEWIKKIKQLTMGWTDGCLDGCEDGRMDGGMDARPDGQINVRADEEMDGRTDEQMDGWMDRGAEGTTLTEISASLLASQIRTDILAHFHPTLTNLQAQLTDLSYSLPGDLVPQINAALTQFYKFAMELSARLERLEKELGLELQPMETELDFAEHADRSGRAHGKLRSRRSGICPRFHI